MLWHGYTTVQKVFFKEKCKCITSKKAKKRKWSDASDNNLDSTTSTSKNKITFQFEGSFGVSRSVRIVFKRKDPSAKTRVPKLYFENTADILPECQKRKRRNDCSTKKNSKISPIIFVLFIKTSSNFLLRMYMIAEETTPSITNN